MTKKENRNERFLIALTYAERLALESQSQAEGVKMAVILRRGINIPTQSKAPVA